MMVTTLSPRQCAQITARACRRAQKHDCFDAIVVRIDPQAEGAFLVTMRGTVHGQPLELQTLAVPGALGNYSCEPCWIHRHA